MYSWCMLTLRGALALLISGAQAVRLIDTQAVRLVHTHAVAERPPSGNASMQQVRRTGSPLVGCHGEQRSKHQVFDSSEPSWPCSPDWVCPAGPWARRSQRPGTAADQMPSRRSAAGTPSPGADLRMRRPKHPPWEAVPDSGSVPTTVRLPAAHDGFKRQMCAWQCPLRSTQGETPYSTCLGSGRGVLLHQTHDGMQWRMHDARALPVPDIRITQGRPVARMTARGLVRNVHQLGARALQTRLCA